MQSHISDTSITNSRYIGAQSIEWTYTNQPLVRPHFLGQGKWDLRLICLSGVEYSPFNIWQYDSVVAYRIFGCNKA